MTFFQAAGAILTNSWNLLTSINYPGTGISIAAILIGSTCAVVSLRFIGHVFSMSFTSSPNNSISKRE